MIYNQCLDSGASLVFLLSPYSNTRYMNGVTKSTGNRLIGKKENSFSDYKFIVFDMNFFREEQLPFRNPTRETRTFNNSKRIAELEILDKHIGGQINPLTVSQSQNGKSTKAALHEAVRTVERSPENNQNT